MKAGQIYASDKRFHKSTSRIADSSIGAFAACVRIIGVTTSWTRWLALALLGVATSMELNAASAAKVDFARDVRPILSGICFKCHGPDPATRKGGLRLDIREEALKPAKSGDKAIVPGKPKESAIIARIFTTDETDLMPPPESKHPLTEAQKEILKQWVQQGAEYQPHWAFTAPKQAPLPKVKDRKWPVNGLDYFVLARLEQEKLKPAKEADRYTLIRRVYLDLVGYPPTPEQVQAFLDDKSPIAYEKVVDELLASPHYGERWARRWLDLARYADTNGYEKDRPRSIWPYRDWVINALNADMPFDQFTIEQLAGDLLPNATIQQKIATGFHRNTMLNEEGGIDPLEFRYYAMVDRVSTTGTTWLGLTVGCAQCHTHKYDPITQTEYYQMMAFLNNADEPEIDLPDNAVEKQRLQNEEQARKLVAALPEKFPISNTQWEAPKITANTGSGKPAELLSDGIVFFGADGPDKDIYTLELEAGLNGVDRIRMEVLPDDRLPKNGPGRSSGGNFVLNNLTADLVSNGQTTTLKFARAEADFSQEGFAVANAIDDKSQTGWAIATKNGNANVKRTATFYLSQPINAANGKLVLKLDQQFGNKHTIGKLRVTLGQAVNDTRPETVRRQEAIDAKFQAWLTAEQQRTVRWQVLKPLHLKANLALLTPQPDDSIFATGDQSKSDTYEITLKMPAGTTALRLEAIPDDRLPAHGPGATFYEGPKGDFFLSEFTATANGKAIKFANASDSYSKLGIGGGSAAARNMIDGDAQSGWSVNGRQGERSVAVFNLAEPLAAGGEVTVKLLFEKHYAAPLGRFRLAATTDKKAAMARDLDERTEALLAKTTDSLSTDDKLALRGAFLMNTPELAAQQAEIQKLRRNTPALPTTLVMRERPPENPRSTQRHHRGEFLQVKEEVKPGTMQFLNAMPTGAPMNRLGFARWLVSTENPLTARVTVNRQWTAFFGLGLVRTTGDFGFQGELPSNPQLLDWLAVEFMKQGWSMKKLHKLIVMSATYRQDSTVTKELLAHDPENKLLARGPRVRLEAELIRDSALKISGLLSAKIGGPSVYPPQPAGVTSEGTYGKLAWNTSEGEDRYRRGLYTFTKRTAPFAMFNTFDAPSGEACVARRDISNTPLQALTMLNDVAFIEAAQALGKQWVKLEGSTEEKLQKLFQRCLTRPATPDEIAQLKSFFEAQRLRLESKELNAVELTGSKEADANQAMWTIMARALLNLDEMVTKS